MSNSGATSIVSAASADIDSIFRLYDAAIAFQKTVFDKHWQGFDIKLVQTEVDEGRLFKIIESGAMACIFSVTFSDPLIWGDRDRQPSMYIHRIATNPDFRGRAYARSITEWAKTYARRAGRKYLRMDTYGDNHKLIDYYVDCGFRFLEIVKPERPDLLPKHYENITLALFEIAL